MLQHFPELGPGAVDRDLLQPHDPRPVLGPVDLAWVAGLRAHGVSAAVAERAAHLPPVSVLFAAFLGYNPIQHLIGPQALAQLPSSAVAQLSSQSFFPA